MTRHVREADITTLLGMNSRTALVVVAFNIGGVVVAATLTLQGVTAPALVAVSVMIHTISVAILLRVPGDPLPYGATVLVTAAGPLSCAIVLSALPVPVASPLQTWPIGTTAGLYTFLCVRGRTWWALSGFLAIAAVTLTWTAITGQSASVAMALVLPSAALVLMGTFFAFAIRSPVHDIFRLREEATRQAAEQAAAAAALDERDAQLTRLDELARPLLTRIASGEELSDDEKLACRLLEHHLRDTLRATGLDEGEVSSAARAARSRGVDVVFLDDRGPDHTDLMGPGILQSVVSALEDTSLRAVTVRLVPHDRDSAASILVDGPEGTRREEFDESGTRLSS